MTTDPLPDPDACPDAPDDDVDACDDDGIPFDKRHTSVPLSDPSDDAPLGPRRDDNPLRQ